jgi:hypothetical protein
MKIMPIRFPFLPIGSQRGNLALMPVMPIELWIGQSAPVAAKALVDSGAAVNVLPYSLGIGLGAVWEAQTTAVTLAGNLAAEPARALMVQARVGQFTPVRLVFAWSRADYLPVLLGQVNFFEEFDITFRRAQRYFEVEPSRK